MPRAKRKKPHYDVGLMRCALDDAQVVYEHPGVRFPA